jgi:ubiquinone/menaquinone biosynthesis C-methylase UbiE
MMRAEDAYNSWASQYDTNLNRTRDLEAISLRETLSDIDFKDCLEIGCGTGKNTEWLHKKAEHVTAVDLSSEMLLLAKKKISSPNVLFVQADITEDWFFADRTYDLISFSLVLEHIQNLDLVFQKAASHLKAGGYVYLGELHPFKQYSGTKARFETPSGTQEVVCFDHHLSDFTSAASKHGLKIEVVKEYFDDNIKTNKPRILTLLFKKA